MSSENASLPANLNETSEALSRVGFALVRAPVMRAALESVGLADWDRFAASWDDLSVDRYMADGGRYRRRRFATFTFQSDVVQRKPHQPHYQSRDYNPLNGGIARWFDPVADDIADHPATLATIELCGQLFTSLTPKETRPKAWHVEMHQFRIEAQSDAAGLPTPEGMHRDGVDWVLVLLVKRHNVTSGETEIADLQSHKLGSFVLTDPLDSALVDDSRVYHGVTPIRPLDPSQPAWRDVLVVTFRRE